MRTPNAETLVLDGNSVHFDLANLHIKPGLSPKYFSIEPTTLVKVAQAGIALYNLLKKKKEKKEDPLANWLVELDMKLDQILDDLKEIKELLIKIEEKFYQIPLILSEENLKNDIGYYFDHYTDLYENPHDPVVKERFQDLYDRIYHEMKTIMDARAYYHVYNIVLAFVIAYDLAYFLRHSKASKRKLTARVTTFLENTINKELEGSFGQILQFFLNEKSKAEAMYYAKNGSYSKGCVLQEKKIENGPMEPDDFSWRVATATYNWSIEGNLSQGFIFHREYKGLSNERWINDILPDEFSGKRNEAATKEFLETEISRLFNSYEIGYHRYLELDKNARHNENIISDIKTYIEILGDLHKEEQDHAVANN